MKKISTPSTTTDKKSSPLGPSQATLLLLRQIARTYTGKSTPAYMPTGLVLN